MENRKLTGNKMFEMVKEHGLTRMENGMKDYSKMGNLVPESESIKTEELFKDGLMERKPSETPTHHPLPISSFFSCDWSVIQI